MDYNVACRRRGCGHARREHRPRGKCYVDRCSCKGFSSAKPRTLGGCQKEVDAWVQQYTPAYWNPHQILTRLSSEVGELAKEINHEFGPLPKKKGEKPSSITEECGDILFTIICLLNSRGLSLEEAFEQAMAKCHGRDKKRFKRAAQ